MYRAVLRIDWQDCCARSVAHSGDERRGRNERLLVRERQPLTRQQRRHRDGQSGKSHDRVHDCVRALGQLAQSTLSDHDVHVAGDHARENVAVALINNTDARHVELLGDGRQGFKLMRARNCDHIKVVLFTPKYIERLRSD